MLQEYWERTPTCFSVAMDYRANYQTADEAPIAPLEDAIRALHRQANNAIVDGYVRRLRRRRVPGRNLYRVCAPNLRSPMAHVIACMAMPGARSS